MRKRKLLLIAVAVSVCFPYCLQTCAEEGAKVDLEKYSLKKSVVLPGISDASGLTYNPITKTLFMVLNGSCVILELGLDGTVKRTIRTKGFNDLEGIVWVEGDTYFVGEERRFRLARVTIKADTRRLDYADAKTYQIEPPGKNKGLEGLTYDADKKVFYVVKERSPRKFLRVKIPPKGNAAEIKPVFDIETRNMRISDLSGIHFDRRTKHFLVVSHESRCVVECNDRAEECSRLSLKAGASGMKKDAPQAEGVTMDDKGNLYICSEPNILYILTRK